MTRLPACFALLIIAADTASPVGRTFRSADGRSTASHVGRTFRSADGRLLARTGGVAAPVQAVESMPLEPEKAVERRLAGGQSHEYQLDLRAGQYARVRADQIDINLAIACFGPDGKERFAVDTSPIGDAEQAELIADAAGIYRLRVTASEPHAPDGRF